MGRSLRLILTWMRWWADGCTWMPLEPRCRKRVGFQPDRLPPGRSCGRGASRQPREPHWFGAAHSIGSVGSMGRCHPPRTWISGFRWRRPGAGSSGWNALRCACESTRGAQPRRWRGWRDRRPSSTNGSAPAREGLARSESPHCSTRAWRWPPPTGSVGSGKAGERICWIRWWRLHPRGNLLRSSCASPGCCCQMVGVPLPCCVRGCPRSRKVSVTPSRLLRQGHHEPGGVLRPGSWRWRISTGLPVERIRRVGFCAARLPNIRWHFGSHA